jgi:hypothetical protein
VHATARTFRVFVTVDVRDAKDPTKLAQRSNRLLFVFVREAGEGIDAEQGVTHRQNIRIMVI